MEKMQNIFRNQNGDTLLIFALAFLGLLAMVGVILDGGKLYLVKVQLQKTANASVLSGAQELTNSQSKVNDIVKSIIQKHDETIVLKSIEVTMDKKVSVSLENDVSLSFLRLFGKDRARVRSHAAAELRVLGRTKGAAPLGIDESIPLEYNMEYKLKVDQTEVDTGNFGVLALGGTGAETYETNLIEGYKNELKVGDVIETQTGNIAGKTRIAIKTRVSSCPYLPGEIIYRDCPRIILIPVYRPYLEDSQQVKEVEITGFAYFYILEPMVNNDTYIKGMFIKRTGTGFEQEGSIGRGAFSIRLTE